MHSPYNHLLCGSLEPNSRRIQTAGRYSKHSPQKYPGHKNYKTPIAALQIQSGLPIIKKKMHEVQINYYAKKIRTDDTKFIEGTQWEKRLKKNLKHTT